MIIRTRVPCPPTCQHTWWGYCCGDGYLVEEQHITTYIAITADGVRTYSDGAPLTAETLADAERTHAWVFGATRREGHVEEAPLSGVPSPNGSAAHQHQADGRTGEEAVQPRMS